MLLIITQTSLQQSTYENTKDIQEVARNINLTTQGIAENTEDIAHKAKEMIVSVTWGDTSPNTHIPQGSRGSRSLGQTQPRA